MMRPRLKRDASEAGIVAALRAAGASVIRMDTPVDLLIGYRGQTHLAEAKTPGTSYGKGLKASQQAFADAWRGGPVIILRSAEDALALLAEATRPPGAP